MSDEPIILEYLPNDVQATIEARDRALAALEAGAGGLGLEFVIDTLRRWNPGSSVTVAFLGGTPALHADIAEVAGEISDACNLTLDFGYDEATGDYRTWSESDTQYSADIRVSFDQTGYFSLVGTDSRAANIGPPDGPVGGRPGQRSLNLGGFDIQRPVSWRGTVLHEFLHALSFHHEHVNRRGPCQEAFRFEDDPGYIPTQDSRDVFVQDNAGRRPGIYTYLAGAPNFWSKAKVDHNLRPQESPGIIEGAFDRSSVMLYRFPALFYRTPNSGCAPAGDGQSLSDGDRAGLQALYPTDSSQVIEAKRATLAGLEAAALEAPGHGLEMAAPAAANSALAACKEMLRAQVGGTQ